VYERSTLDSNVGVEIKFYRIDTTCQQRHLAKKPSASAGPFTNHDLKRFEFRGPIRLYATFSRG